MHQARAVLGGDVVAEDDVVGGLAGGELDEVEGPGVLPALHVRAVDALEHLPALTEGLAQQRLGDHERLGAVGGHDVGDLGVDGDRGVGHQRPRRRRPHQQARAPGQRTACQREPDVDAGVGDGLVALRQLVVRQPGAAARAVRRHPVVLDQQAGGVDLLQRPPHRLDVLGRHGGVGVLEVDPVAHPVGHLRELADVAQHRLTAAGVELGDSERLDVLLAGEAELLLDGELDGKAVAVPAGLPLDVVALHRAEAGEDVLEDAGLDVVGAGQSVGRRRALVEGPRLGAAGPLQRGGEGVVLAPELEHLVLQRGQVDLRGDRAVGRAAGAVGAGVHGCVLVCRSTTQGYVEPATKGRGRSIERVPRYHPPWPPRVVGMPSRARPLPVLPARDLGHGRSSGGSGVIFAPASTPGLTPSPSRSRLVPDLLVPSSPCVRRLSLPAPPDGSNSVPWNRAPTWRALLS